MITMLLSKIIIGVCVFFMLSPILHNMFILLIFTISEHINYKKNEKILKNNY